MLYEKIDLRDLYPCLQGGTLSVIALDKPLKEEDPWARPAVIVVPGGAYRHASKREGEPVAANFLSAGYQVCVLDYLCQPEGARYPEQLFELACAVDFLHKHATRFSINPKEIFVVGFSAGGHLVADFSNEYPSLRERTRLDLDCAVKAVGLAYPVINDHDESYDNLLCGYPKEEDAELRALLKQDARVGAHTPPTFLWTTAEDRLVPPHNTLDYALALSLHDIPFECHVYPQGGHGKANGSAELNDDARGSAILSSWTADMARFFRSYCEEAY